MNYRRVRAAVSLLALFAAMFPAVDAAGEIPVLRDLERATVAVIEKTRPGFVFIKARQSPQSMSGGSGFAFSADGLVLTNEHVIAGSSEIYVYFTGGKGYRAEVVGHDPQGDVALLKIKTSLRVPFLELGDSDEVRAGDRVVALGDPFLLGSDAPFPSQAPPDFEPSASMGIVSAIHRYSDSYNDAIQVDLAVNRGNSGGPLLDLDGRVIGINGKIETRFELGINTGVGYAIPANQIRRFIPALLAAGGGEVRHGSIRGLAVAGRADDRPGLPVTAVEPGSPAARFGFQNGDLIVALGGLSVRTQSRYLGILGTYPAGDEVAVRVRRGEADVALSALLVAAGNPYLGIKLEQLAGEALGVRVASVEAGSPAQRAGLKEGDIIEAINDDKVVSSTDLVRLLRQRSPGDEIRVSLRRGEAALAIQVALGGR